MTDIRFNPVLPISVIVLMVVICAALFWLSMRRIAQPLSRRLMVFAVRMVGIALIGALLLQPDLLRIYTTEQAPVLAVLVDTSKSMLDSPNRNANTRREHAEQFLRSRAFNNGTQKYTIRWYRFGDKLEDALAPESQPIQFLEPRTNIIKALNDVAKRNRGANLAGVILLTDGLDQSIQTLQPEALAVPVFIPELEEVEAKTSRPDTPDVTITELDHPSMLVVNWQGEVSAVVKRDRSGKRLVCEVKLTENGSVLRTSTLVFEAKETTKTISFDLQPTTVGRMTYTIEIKPERDRLRDNNRKIFAIDVTDPKNRVLYIEGTPRWEFKYLKRALMRETTYQVSAYVQSAPGVFINFSEGAESAEVSDMPKFAEGETLKFKAIILGELKASSFDEKQQQALVNYVERGGGVLFLAGKTSFGPDGWPSSGTVEKLLPFTNEPKAAMADGRFSLTPTAAGRAHPIFKGLDPELGLPEILSLWRPTQKRATATSILEAPDGSPILLAARFGKGKVVALMTDSLWRWQLAAPTHTEGKGLYESFVGQILYWLSPQKKEIDATSNLQVVTASPEAEVRQRVNIGAFATQGSAKRQLRCLVKMPDNRTITYDMTAGQLGANVGLTKPVWGWLANFVPHIPGNYEITVRETASAEQATTRVIVTEPQVERTGKAINRKYLRRLAMRTGGKFYTIRNHSDLPFDVPFEPDKVKTIDQRPIWNLWPLLVVLIGLFTLEWILRSKFDMV